MTDALHSPGSPPPLEGFAETGLAGRGLVDEQAVEPLVGQSFAETQAEIDMILEVMQGFAVSEPDQIIRECIGFGSRLNELVVRIERLERTGGRAALAWKQVRTREIERIERALQESFERASRLHTIRVDDFKMETGER